MTDQNNQGAQGYYGQAGLNDATSPYNAMTFVIKQMLAKTRTMVLVKVTAVDAAAKTVDVQPLVKQMDGVGNSSSMGMVFGLPYIELRGGGNAIRLTPAVDDIGIAIVADRDISAVKATSAEAPPGSFRRFNLADGVYLGGILASGDPDQSVTFGEDGITFSDKNGNTITTSAAGMTLADNNANQIQMVAGFVNIQTPVLKVNGVPVTVP